MVEYDRPYTLTKRKELLMTDEPLSGKEVGKTKNLPPEMTRRTGIGSRVSKWTLLYEWLETLEMDGYYHHWQLPSAKEVPLAKHAVRAFVTRRNWAHNFDAQPDKDGKYLDLGHVLSVKAIPHKESR